MNLDRFIHKGRWCAASGHELSQGIELYVATLHLKGIDVARNKEVFVRYYGANAIGIDEYQGDVDALKRAKEQNAIKVLIDIVVGYFKKGFFVTASGKRVVLGNIRGFDPDTFTWAAIG